MLKYILTLAPYVFNTSSKAPSKSWVEAVTIFMLFFFAAIALVAALFVWVTQNYGLDFGFLVIGVTLLIAAIILVKVSDNNVEREVSVKQNIESDPLVSHLPTSITKDPTVQRALTQISENPLAASTAAMAIGVLISRELFGKK